MIISRMIQTERLSLEDIGKKVILPSASNELGHAIQGGCKGKLFHFFEMEDGRTRITMFKEDPQKDSFHAFLKPGWAVIFPLDGRGHTW